MLNGKPLFPGRDCALALVFQSAPLAERTLICRRLSADHHQLTLILGVLGTPSLDDFYAIGSKRSRDYLRALPFQKKKPLQSLYPNANPLAIDLLERCLTFNPKKRMSVVDALSHRVSCVSLVSLRSCTDTLPSRSVPLAVPRPRRYAIGFLLQSLHRTDPVPPTDEPTAPVLRTRLAPT